MAWSYGNRCGCTYTNQSRLLQSLGVMDSKEVPLERLTELANEIEVFM